MTIICYKDGILAGDSSGYSADVTYMYNTNKLFLYNNIAYGFSGDTIAVEQYKKFIKKEIKEFKIPENFSFNAIKIDLKTKEIFKLESQDNIFVEIKIENKFFAIGFGLDLALGSMEMGASSIGACKIACKYSVCNEPIYCIDINSKKPEIMKCL